MLNRIITERLRIAFQVQEMELTEDEVNELKLMGISGISNKLCAIKFAKYYELKRDDVVAVILTAAIEMHLSGLEELRYEKSEYANKNAAVDYAANLQGI